MNDKLNKWVMDKLSKNSWSLRELGRKAGINPSLVSTALSGKRTPGLDFYVKVARAFGEETIPEMLCVAGLLPARIYKDEYSGLLWTIKQLTDEDKKIATKFIDFLRYKQTVEQLTGEEKKEFFKFADFLLLKREVVTD